MNLKFIAAFVLILNILTKDGVNSVEYEVHRIESVILPDPFWDLNLKLKRVRPGVYVFEGYMILKFDLDDTYIFDVKADHSPTGGNSYTVIPVRLPRTPFCKFMNTYYQKYFMKELSASSNFPYIKENENYCPLTKGNYTVNKYEFEGKNLPKFIKPGFYRLNFTFNRITDNVVGMWTIHCKVLSVQ